jgi:hypothetical protein
MGEYAAILAWTSAGAVIASLFVLFHVRVPPRRPPPTEPFEPIDLALALDRFQLQAAIFIAFAFLVVVLAAWAAAAGVLGRAGLGVATLTTLPLVVGFAHLAARREIEPPADTPEESDESADAGPGTTA